MPLAICLRTYIVHDLLDIRPCPTITSSFPVALLMKYDLPAPVGPRTIMTGTCASLDCTLLIACHGMKIIALMYVDSRSVHEKVSMQWREEDKAISSWLKAD